MSDRFVSCDWGTSALRLSLVDRTCELPLASLTSGEGSAAVYAAWKASSQPASEREAFHLAVLRRHLDALAVKSGESLSDVAVIASGMVSSSIGLRDVPHRVMPFALDGSDLQVEAVESEAFAGGVWIVSGARTENDVMRGEEVQIVGAVALGAPRRARFVLPGTHSKHVTADGARATDLRTYLTGELFELLSKRSILANSVDADGQLPPDEAAAAFEEGVSVGANGNLANTIFGVRVADLQGRRSKAAGYHYLSGLLIGSELRDLRADTGEPIVLVGDARLAERYARALAILGHKGLVSTFAAAATVSAGHRITAERLGLFG